MYSCSDTDNPIFSPLKYFECGNCVDLPTSPIGAICNPCGENETSIVCLNLPDKFPAPAALIDCKNGEMAHIGTCDSTGCCGTCTD